MAELNRALPKPKYSGYSEDLPNQKPKLSGPTIIPDESRGGQLVKKSSGSPAYGSRAHWRPRLQADFGDGGAFPECHIAQYPLDMGKSRGASNALVLKEGDSVAETIAKRGQSSGKVVHASFKDLIPLRQRADAGEIDLSRPDAEAVAATKQKTAEALQLLVSSATAAQKAKSIKKNKDEPTYVRYTAASGQMGRQGGPSQDRIIKIVERQMDPLAPNMWKKKKIPKGPAEPQVPIMHSPPRKPTEDELAMAKLPPSISNWKNSKGYTIALDKRLAANGRGLEDKTINDKFGSFAEALYTADKLAREEVRQRAAMQQKLNEREEEAKAEKLRQLAAKAREDRAAASRKAMSRSRSRSASYSRSERDSESEDESEEEAANARIKARKERDRENERELRQQRMGAERRVQMMARESGRDISEKIALGLAKPTSSGEAMYDSRLFNSSSGFAAGFNEDQPYDKPLFQAQDALSALYRPKAVQDEGEDEGQTYDRITKSKRFEGFGGGNAEERQGPVQFEKDIQRGAVKPKTAEDDPFGIDQMISDATGGKAGGKKRYGLQDEADERETKRVRVESDEE